MTDDEKALYNLVREKMPASGSGTKADVEVVRTLAGYGKSVFPKQFMDVLFDEEDLTYKRYHNVRFSSLHAILDAYEAIPDSLRTSSASSATIEDELDPTFSLAPSETALVFRLCAEIRAAISSSKLFDVPHKRRLLNRVASIEREIHLPKGRLDVILGGMSDFGETLGKFGKDVKPLVDRMTEIMGIAREKSEDYDQLPRPDEVKRLPPPDDSQGGSA
ncbi:hypothetical protein [Tabrizicola fusiformis]|uniref:hypothetical protein n=1 Tax=Tabrizicola sp. SY72 TaxID=2741673 RepID=UPI0015731FFA|nr:hypothetical protein [Tabrizicola sp. SY72]NTT85186.1 hypothetical protein [Tabrizicola sp. SY72]